jgi:hypothetical protein
LKPVLLTIANVPFNDPDLVSIQDQFYVFKTKRGYQTEESMKFYINSVLVPYYAQLREEQNDPDLPIFLVTDNCDTRRTEAVMQMYREIKITPIWMPAHSSHFLQPLDLVIFGVFKSAYLELKTKMTTPRIEGKMIRIMKCWWNSS